MIPINGIRGWSFAPEVVEAANESGQLLTFDFELGEACCLNCIYCYRTLDQRDDDPVSHRHKPLLAFSEWKRVVDQAVELGAQSVKLIGGGELMEEPDFREAVQYLASKGLTTVLFTAGTVLGDASLCQRLYGMSPSALARWMHDDLGMSVFLKMDAMDADLQDEIAGLSGYAVIRDRAFQVLLDAGFNNHSPTRLGLEVNVGRRNLHEIMKIYELRVTHNVYEDVVLSMPCDVYYRNTDYDITLDQKKDLFRKVYAFNRQHGIPFDHVSPFMGGLECTQLGNGLYVTNRGDVYHCPGTFELLGSVKQESLTTIWGRCTQAQVHHSHYFCPFREKASIIPTELVRELETEFLGRTDSVASQAGGEAARERL